ncbi:MAG: VOC family protein [Candidatus Kariarchaeaceae archaeon]|jgi:catechol 2,3-dioxygenase-like lactoylglutathione lyase family enzyme
MEAPRLGHHFEICIDVDDMEESIEFYSNLGFTIYTGGADKGWCTLTDGLVYFALFSGGFIKHEFGVPVLFNYRGGNTPRINAHLEKMGVEFLKREENVEGPGTGDTIILDPNGYKFYFDTTKDEDRVDTD